MRSQEKQEGKGLISSKITALTSSGIHKDSKEEKDTAKDRRHEMEGGGWGKYYPVTLICVQEMWSFIGGSEELGVVCCLPTEEW